MLMRDILTDMLGLDQVSFLVAEIVGFIGVTVMAYGALTAAWHFIETTFHQKADGLLHMRVELGKHLALGLEFLVGKDIIESIVRPSWDDLGKLAAIIALRTAVTFMLSWELKEVKEELAEQRLHRRALGKRKRKRA